MITSTPKVTSWFCRLGAGSRYRSTLFLYLSIFATAGFFYYVAHIGNDQVATERFISASALSTMKSMPYTRIEDEEALVDNKTKSMEDLALEAAATIRNIPSPPYILGEESYSPTYFHNSSCARFPTIHDIEFSNIYWQTLRTSNGTLYLYGAYFDIRNGNPLGPTLRILGMMNRIEPNVTTHCQIWFQGEKEPIFSKVLEYNWIWHKEWGNYQQGIYEPYLLTCQVPRSHDGKVPASVSVVEKPCDAANNNLRVVFNKPARKKTFGVCVKGLNYIQEDLSVRLVEWIELIYILGADKIYTYEYGLHPNSTKVLRYYEQRGKLDVTPITLPGSHPSDPRILHMFMQRNVGQRYLHELISLNDCMYRNLYKYEYIAVVDTDEVILPMKAAGWKDLMLEVVRQSRLISNDSRSSYSFRQLHFVDDVSQGHKKFEGIPKYLYMLQNVYRSPKHQDSGDGTKCFHNPERVLTLHNHFPMACLNNSCSNYDVEIDLAQLNHYRQDCLLRTDYCTDEYRQSTLLDTTLWRFKDELINRTRKVLGSLGFIPSLVANKLTATN